MLIHVVRPGETLFSIAGEYDVSAALLTNINGLRTDAPLVVGQTLIVRSPAQVHTVAPGDTVYSIAGRYGVSVLTIYRNNFSLLGQPDLRTGEELVIAYGDDARIGRIGVNAYAYPYVDETLRDAALPFLSYLTPFTYGVSRDGRLLALEDAALLSAAARYRTAPLMHLSTLTEEGNFSNERSSLLLNSPDLQEALIQDVIETMRRKNYFGLDVDFEFIYPTERTLYADFIRTLRERLNPLGYPVIVALAPKTRADQPGLLYEAHDYALLGAAANAVLLMTYEWGYTYGPPMAVAPLDQVRAVLDYAVSEIAPERILLGIPLYGYDWPLPYQRGVTRADSISPQYAVELARQSRAEILYDEQAQSPYFYYTARSGQEHVVWFEDARSMDAKLRLIAQYGLQGAGYWNLMRAMPQNWTLLHALYDVETLV